MSCENERAQLIAHLYGELETDEARRFEDHLSTCAGCRREWERLRRVSDLLGEWRMEEEPWLAAARAKRSRRELLRERLRRWWSSPMVAPRWALGGALAAVLLAAFLGSQIDVTRETDGIRVAWGSSSSIPAGREGDAPVTTGPERDALARTAAAGPGDAVRSVGRDQALLTAVETMIAQSEDRQLLAFSRMLDYYNRQSEFARAQDLQAMRNGLGTLSGETRAELARTNSHLEQMATMLMRQGNYQPPATEARLGVSREQDLVGDEQGLSEPRDRR